MLLRSLVRSQRVLRLVADLAEVARVTLLVAVHARDMRAQRVFTCKRFVARSIRADVLLRFVVHRRLVSVENRGSVRREATLVAADILHFLVNRANVILLVRQRAERRLTEAANVLLLLLVHNPDVRPEILLVRQHLVALLTRNRHSNNSLLDSLLLLFHQSRRTNCRRHRRRSSSWHITVYRRQCLCFTHRLAWCAVFFFF